MNGSNGLLTEDRMVQSSEAEVMVQVILHALSIHSFEMTSCNHSGGQRQRGSPVEFIQEVILAGQDDGEDGFRVSFELTESVDLGKDFQSQKGSLIQQEKDLLLFTQDDILDRLSDDPG
jgi:hypothetical protein